MSGPAQRAVMRWVLLGLLTLAAGPAHAQGLAAKLADARVGARAEVALAQDEALAAFTFHPTAEAGVLTVLGVVETQGQRARVAEVAGGVEGVVRVVNQVQVTAQPRARTGPRPAEPATTEKPEATEPEATEDEEVGRAAAPAQEPVYHTVRRGDTLGAIAQRYGVTVRQVQQLNGLRGTRIRVGQRLRVN